MKKLGFLMDRIGFDDMAYHLINNFNKPNLDLDVIAFIQEYDRPPALPRFAVMQDKEAHNYSGTLIATSINTARKLRFYKPAKKYFYLWSLEWVRLDSMSGQYSMDELSAAYQNDEVDLIVRSPQHQQIIKSVWGKDALIIEDFNYEKFIGI